MLNAKIMGVIVAFISGLMFGSGMVISGMADPSYVIAFLNVTGAWDPRLLFVMGGALLVFIPFYHLLIKKRKTAILGKEYALQRANTIDPSLIVGAVIFGLGWGVAGICPGPAITNLAGGSAIFVVFVLSMLVGIWFAHYYTRHIRRL